jgi:BirA family biotin operon repressor/biotin-[acetyl-CoA-carboxylase] ligase
MSIEQIKKILLILNDGRFHSGAELGQELNITRSAIWKITKQLDQYAIELESVVGKGYRMKKTLDLLSVEKIRQQLSPQTNNRLKCIEVFDALPSSQQYLLSRIYETSKQPRLCASEYAIPEKLKRGHHPTAAFGQHIDCALLWCQQQSLKTEGMNVAIGVSVLKVLQQLGLERLGLQWPHTITQNQKPIAHFNLITRQHPNRGQIYILQVCIKLPSQQRNTLIAKLSNQLLYAMDLFKLKGTHLFIDDWNQHDISRGRMIKLHLNDQALTAKSHGLNKAGRLQVEDSQGRIHSYPAVDIEIVNSKIT